MAQEPRQPINLSVHESSDPSLISPNSRKEPMGGEFDDLNDSSHDDDNVDVPIPNPSDESRSDENIVDSQISIANLSAG